MLRAMLDAAGSMLSTDEQALAEQSPAGGRSLFQVTDIDPDTGLTLRGWPLRCDASDH